LCSAIWSEVIIERMIPDSRFQIPGRAAGSPLESGIWNLESRLLR
jgi:hypothetical protein